MSSFEVPVTRSSKSAYTRSCKTPAAEYVLSLGFRGGWGGAGPVKCLETRCIDPGCGVAVGPPGLTAATPYGHPCCGATASQLHPRPHSWTPLWRIPTAELWLTAALPVENPCCSCKLTHVANPVENPYCSCKVYSCTPCGQSLLQLYSLQLHSLWIIPTAAVG